MRSLREADLLVATGNAGKLAEFSALLEPYGTRILSLRDFGLPEPDETEFSFSGNALVKARAAAQRAGIPCLADDSGLEVEALGGAPGIHTADWAETSRGRSFLVAMKKTWGLLQATGAAAPWRARFVCVLALAQPDGSEALFPGRLEGEIVWPPRGEHGHGYDPIFRPLGQDLTMGEMSAEAKNLISHRADAVRKFIAACFT